MRVWALAGVPRAASGHPPFFLFFKHYLGFKMRKWVSFFGRRGLCLEQWVVTCVFLNFSSEAAPPAWPTPGFAQRLSEQVLGGPLATGNRELGAWLPSHLS